MSEHENELEKALTENGHFDAEKATRVAAEAVARFNVRLKWTERYGMIVVLLCMAVFEFAVLGFVLAYTTKAMIGYAIVILVSYGLGILVAFHSQITSMLLRTLKEIKQLQLESLGYPIDRTAARSEGKMPFIGRPRALGRRETIGWTLAILIVAIAVGICTERYLPWAWPSEMSRFEGVPVTLDAPPGAGSPIHVHIYLRMEKGSCRVLRVTPRQEEKEFFWMGKGFARISLSAGDKLRLDPQGNKGEYWVRFEG